MKKMTTQQSKQVQGGEYPPLKNEQTLFGFPFTGG